MSNNTFQWDPMSAGRKFIKGADITIGLPSVASITRKTDPHDPKTDAYRSCSKCGKHWNLHKNGKCR